MSYARYEGWLLAGRYRLLSELGQGGMGRVWRAHDELLDRQVAVKEVTIVGPQHEELLARTMREARIAARLSHPHIAAMYDVVLADERPWIVMQLIPARSLAQVIAEQGPLPVPTVTRIGLELLDALRAAHAAGVLHRDIKPGNILLTDDEHAVLTDFGLATTVDDESQVSRTSMVVGTPAYIAPERAGGAPSTPQADLWSLGATLYTAVEGHSPFGRSTETATLTAILTSSAYPFSLAGPLAPAIAGLLDKDPAQRSDLARAHEQLLRVAAQPEPAAPSHFAGRDAYMPDEPHHPHPAANPHPDADPDSDADPDPDRRSHLDPHRDRCSHPHPRLRLGARSHRRSLKTARGLVRWSAATPRSATMPRLGTVSLSGSMPGWAAMPQSGVVWRSGMVRRSSVVRRSGVVRQSEAARRAAAMRRSEAVRRLLTERWRETALIAALIASVIATGSWWNTVPSSPAQSTPAQSTPADIATALALDLTSIPQQVHAVSRKRLTETSDGRERADIRPNPAPETSSGKSATALKKAKKAAQQAAKKAAKKAAKQAAKLGKTHGNKH
ncbi:serine/threonine-protein kinase [Nonomuraea aurantiaca]|uniref:serine/threonine-protein kinase n=1 Tax=Nonomuraea aurantiaca TaxID=2878562 RepID=UPI0021E65D08|nr:serine/threonine-protein kinase [Nonomuraea aurantiaca]